jgi:hypothetical protein
LTTSTPSPKRQWRERTFFRRWYFGPDADAPAWRRIDAAWLGGVSELALALDSATNNTSLVLAIELAGADVLLFAADAQVGNWLSWQNLKWTFDNRTVTGPDLLSRTVFYKVGQHGSHNATLRDKGLELMTQLSIAAIPVYHDMAVKKHWGNMPLPALVDGLKGVAKSGVFRSDETPEQLPTNVIADPSLFRHHVLNSRIEGSQKAPAPSDRIGSFTERWG